MARFGYFNEDFSDSDWNNPFSWVPDVVEHCDDWDPYFESSREAESCQADEWYHEKMERRFEELEEEWEENCGRFLIPDVLKKVNLRGKRSSFVI
jgi:hypothetical protein